MSSQYLSGKSVYLGSESLINDALHRGGAVVVRLYLDEPHYVLLTGEHDGVVEMFDPYYRAEPFNEQDILLVTDRDTMLQPAGAGAVFQSGRGDHLCSGTF